MKAWAWLNGRTTQGANNTIFLKLGTHLGIIS
jgi:hypothetical protein